MSNFVLFSISNIFSSFGFIIIFYASYFGICFINTSFLDFTSICGIYFFIYLLSNQISGFVIDKFKKKLVFVFLDFIRSLLLLIFLFYCKIFEVKNFAFLFLLSLSAIFDCFSFTATKSIIPLVSNKEDTLNFNAIQISSLAISKILVGVFVLASIKFYKTLIIPAIFSTSILFFISAILKSFIIVKEIEIQKETFINYVSAGWNIIFKKRTILFPILTQIISGMFFFSLFSTIVPYLIKTSLENSSPELMNHLNISANLKPEISFNIPLFVMLIVFLFISIGSIFYVTFYRINLAYEGDPYGKEGGRLLDYFLLPFCLVTMLHFIYSSFFQKNHSLQTVLFCFKEYTFYLNFMNFLSALHLVALTLSIVFFCMFKNKIKVIKGMKFMQYSFLPCFSVMSLLVIYFGALGKGTILNLLFFLTILTPFSIFALTANTIYLANFYQSRIPNGKLGRFFSVLITLSLISNFLGKRMYEFMINNTSLFSIAILLILASLLNLFVFKKFEKECDKEAKI